MGVIIFHFQMIKEWGSEVKWVVQGHHLACGLWDPIQCPTPHPTHRLWCCMNTRVQLTTVTAEQLTQASKSQWTRLWNDIIQKDDNHPFRWRILGFWHTLNGRQCGIRQAELWRQPGRTGLEPGPWCSHWIHSYSLSEKHGLISSG